MNHNIQSFNEIKPNIVEIKNKMNEMKKTIDLLDVHIKEIIKCLNNVKENMDIYYEIYNNIINNYKLYRITSYFLNIFSISKYTYDSVIYKFI